MKKMLPTTALVLLSFSICLAQESKPTATPTDDNEVVRISTNLIQIDVTVTDSKGRVIPDITADEIEIYENGKLQKTTNFSFVSNERAVVTKSGKTDKKTLGELPPPSPLKPEDVRRTVAIVVDDLTLSHSSVFWVRRALKKFVLEQMQEGDLVAILRSGAGVGALQQFTSDKRQLLAAVEKIQFNMSGLARTSNFNPIQPTLKEQMSGTTNALGRTRNFDEEIERERAFDQGVNEFRESIFAAGTLGAINYVVRGMKTLPGRKSILLLSDGFRISTRDARGIVQAEVRVRNALRSLTDLANRAGVVVYTIDARGLVFDGATAADDTFGLSSDQVASRLEARRNELVDTQDGLVYLARETGGIAMINQNDISRGIEKVLDDQSYYLIGYEPDSDTFDPATRRYNKLDVKVNRAGAKARYRSGFFAISDEQIAKTQKPAMAALFDALTSPFSANDISLRLNALYAADEKRANYLRSFLHIDAKNLTFISDGNGKHKASFDMVASTFGDNGIPLDSESKTYTMTFTDDALQNLKRTGMIYHFTFPIKKAGAYQMRVAIRDTASNRVGSANQFVEVPNLKKKRLTLSGVILENLDFLVWQKLDKLSSEEAAKHIDPLRDTAVRHFSPGSVLTYAANIYNGKLDSTKQRNLSFQARLFKDTELVFEGKSFKAGMTGATSPDAMVARGSIRLPGKSAPGSYTLQVIVTDHNAKVGRNRAFQFTQFEIDK